MKSAIDWVNTDMNCYPKVFVGGFEHKTKSMSCPVTDTDSAKETR